MKKIVSSGARGSINFKNISTVTNRQYLRLQRTDAYTALRSINDLLGCIDINEPEGGYNNAYSNLCDAYYGLTNFIEAKSEAWRKA